MHNSYLLLQIYYIFIIHLLGLFKYISECICWGLYAEPRTTLTEHQLTQTKILLQLPLRSGTKEDAVISFSTYKFC